MRHAHSLKARVSFLLLLPVVLALVVPLVAVAGTGKATSKGVFASNDAKVKSYSASYLWQARGYTAAETDGEGWFRTLVGEDMPSKAIIGTRLGDFDGNGKKEQLVVRWKKGSVRLELRDAENDVLCKGTVPDSKMGLTTGKLPLSSKGDLDVLVDDKDRIIVQYWSSPTGIASGIEWALGIFEPKGTSLVWREVTWVSGSAMFDMAGIRSKLDAESIPSGSVPLEDRESYAYLSSPYADHESSVHVVTRITVTDDDFLAGDWKNSLAHEASQMASSGATEWCDPQPMGRFVVTPGEELESAKATDKTANETARYEEGDRITVTGVMRVRLSEYKGSVGECEVFVLDQPVDAFVASYPANPDEPSLHEGVTSAAVQWRDGESVGDVADKRMRVSGIVQAGSKRTPRIEADGTFYEGAGVLVIRDATFELL